MTSMRFWLLFSDQSSCSVWKIDVATTKITLYAGWGVAYSGCGLSGDGGAATSAKFEEPAGLVFNSSGDLFIADLGNNLVRAVDHSSRKIYTVAGLYTLEHFPNMCGLFECNKGGFFLRKKPLECEASVYSNSGNAIGNAFGAAGYAGDNGPAAAAYLDCPWWVAFDASGNLYIADGFNHVIRKVAAGKVLPSTAPTISPATGEFSSSEQVTITPAKSGQTMYYTTDGSVPTTASTKYTGPFPVTKTSVVTAFAAGSPNSTAAVTNYFYLDDPVLKASKSENSDGYCPTGTTVSISDVNSSAALYYYLDSGARTKYTKPITLSNGLHYIYVGAWATLKGPSGRVVYRYDVTDGTYNVLAAPVPTTLAATKITSTTAVLNGSVTLDMTSDNYVNTQFVWGTAAKPTANTTSTSTISVSKSSAASVSVSLSGLTPSTTYSFVFRAQDGITSPSYVSGKTLTFTTAAK